MAVVAAILKSGLRIMPHSGGRVGSGIYFASENSKSADYGSYTVNSENFARVLFSRNFPYAKFRENKIFLKC